MTAVLSMKLYCVYLFILFIQLSVSGCNEISNGLPILATKCTLHEQDVASKCIRGM